MALYYWLFRRSADSSLARRAWRNYAAALTLAKHLRRGNVRQSWPWLRWFFKT